MHLSAAAAAAAAAATAEATMATKIYGALFTERTESIATKRYVEVISVESFLFQTYHGWYVGCVVWVHRDD